MIKNTILQGDVIDITKTLLAESINCIVTSPPYFGLRNYNLPAANWSEVTYAPMAGLPSITVPAVSCCLGLEDSIEGYVGHIVLVFRELWRVLRGDGTAWLNLGDSYANSPKGSIVTKNSTLSGSKTYQTNGTPPKLLDKSKSDNVKPKNLIGIPWRIAFALQVDGWYLRSEIIWHKTNPMPESVTDRPTKAHEQIFLLSKSARYFYDHEAIKEMGTGDNGGGFGPKSPNGTFRKDTGRPRGDYSQGRNKRTVWPLATKPYKEAHFAVMPEALVEPCLLAGCPSRVCVKCGEPWVRVVEKIKKSMPVSERHGRTDHNGQPPQISGNYWDGPTTKTTNQYRPTCQCSAPTQPGVVLDPFFGAGTVGVVAKVLKRDFIGIELNKDYVEMAQKRLDQTQPALFAII